MKYMKLPPKVDFKKLSYQSVLGLSLQKSLVAALMTIVLAIYTLKKILQV